MKIERCEARVLQPPHYLNRERCSKPPEGRLDGMHLCALHSGWAKRAPGHLNIWRLFARNGL